MGERKAACSSKAGRQRALFHSRACGKMPTVARNGLAGNSKQTLNMVRRLQGWLMATTKRKPQLERTHHQNCCSAPLNSSEHVLVGTARCHSKPQSELLPAGGGTQFNPFWQAGGWWEVALSPRLLSSLAPWWGAFVYKVMTELSLIPYFNSLTWWFCSETTATVCASITICIGGTFPTTKSHFVFSPIRKNDAINKIYE